MTEHVFNSPDRNGDGQASDTQSAQHLHNDRRGQLRWINIKALPEDPALLLPAPAASYFNIFCFCALLVLLSKEQEMGM